jgi:hypothetical protein
VAAALRSAKSEVELTEGEHTLVVGSRELVFEVPGILDSDAGCLDLAPP